MKRQGGFVNNYKEVLTFLKHSIIGHPVNKIQSIGMFGYWCSECGASTGKPEERHMPAQNKVSEADKDDVYRAQQTQVTREKLKDEFYKNIENKSRNNGSGRS